MKLLSFLASLPIALGAVFTYSVSAAPLNDSFSARITLTGSNITTTGSNVGATKEAGEPLHFGNSGGASVWWNWTAPASGPVTIDTVGSTFDTLLVVYTGTSVSALTQVAGDDDTLAPQSQVQFNATQGVQYRIVVDGFGNAQGSITLHLTPSASLTLIPSRAIWKYLDDGSNQNTAWRTNTYDDTSWASGQAELGYGDGDETTVVSFGPDSNNKHITTYFRHTFAIADPSSFTVLTLRVVRDDGVALFLNGVEVFRNNLAANAAFDTTAPTAISGADESTFLETTVNASLLRPGNNVLAAEIHQQSASSSTDISFNLELIGNTGQIINNPPAAAISSPGNNAAFNQPANFTISAVASDVGGSVAKVEFYDGTTKLGEDSSNPYSYDWNNAPLGNHALRAIAVDNLDARGTSAVVNVTVSISSPPTVFSKTPAPGTVNSLTSVSVNFSEPVSGVDAADLLVNGLPATELTGSVTNYTFGFLQPHDGTVTISWSGAHGIRDFESTPRSFDSSGVGATWQYNFVDLTAPTVVALSPSAGATVSALSQISVLFNEGVEGVEASDLRINNNPATGLSGSGAGPYVFTFAAPSTGTVAVAWAAGHGIRDLAAAHNPFAGGSWNYLVDPNSSTTTLVINEIMYHPVSELITDEWVELFNTGFVSVNLTGWHLNRGVDFTFPAVTIPARGYLVVAANVAAFHAKYPSVNNVVGGWTGRLSNSRDSVELEDAIGTRVDLVDYADEGDFAIRRRWPQDTRGWEWYAEHDGLGKSLELVNSALPNDNGVNWLSSIASEGTPGTANSVASTNVAPLILDVAHFPPIPKSTNSITITARIIDEATTGLTVALRYRDATTAAGGNFLTSAMFDDGAHNDGAAGDRVYGVTLLPLNNLTVIEYYVEARDAGNRVRTWPAAAQQAGGTFEQAANALFQVDDGSYSGPQPIYKLIMTEADRSLFANLDRGSDAQINGTFITVEGSSTKVRHNFGVRFRGASSRGRNPPGMRLNIPSDRPWNDVTSLNLNSQYVHAQLMGAVLSQKAGLPAADTRAIQLRINGANPAGNGSPQFGSYVHVEPLNGEWAGHHFPNDGGGNVYGATRPETSLVYLGNNPVDYLNQGYSKQSNASENDWTDLFALTFALDFTTPDANYLQSLRQRVNIDNWLKYFATYALMEYTETALGTGVGDDYSLYRGIEDPRFIALPHDYDTILGQGDTPGNPNESIFIATALPVINRFLHHPEIEPLYYAELRRLLATTFSTNQIYPLLDQVLGGWVPDATIATMKAFVLARNAGVLAQLPAPPALIVQATIKDEPASPTYATTALLKIGGDGVTHYRAKLNSGAYGPETPVATPLTLSGLANGTYTVSVIGRDTAGTYQSQANPTLSKTWTVNTALARVVLNEVLARNVSAISHGGTFPDVIELYNPTAASVSLAGMGLTDDPAAPYKFAFPAGTSIAAGGYLTVFANNSDGTPGLHVGFSLDQNGEAVYLYLAPAQGGLLSDWVSFGPQLPNLSVGRLPNNNWGLATPSSNTVNVAAATGATATLKINEWLADGLSPFVNDYVELYNPDPLPVDLGGLYLTDNPIGDPARHQIVPLSFIEGQGYAVYIADSSTNQADHVGFNLASEFGTIGLMTPGLAVIDCVVYVQQQPGVAQGRYPNGGNGIYVLTQPTPGAGNPRPNIPVPPQTISILPIAQVWKFEASNTDLGTAWRAPGFNDAAWASGAALLGQESSTLPEPIRTQVLSPQAGGPLTSYYRTHFNFTPNAGISSIELQHIIDDGAIFYLNGTELTRFNMPAGTVTHDSVSGPSIDNASFQGAVNIPAGSLLSGDNVLAVELHQSSGTSSDTVMGVRIDATIVTNSVSQSGIRINEVLANNASILDPDGSKPDWIELYNPGDSAVDLANMSLSDRLDTPRRWAFPAPSVITGRGFFRVRLDGSLPSSPTNTGFGLKASGDSIYLFNKPASGAELLDSITFGLQVADLSIGRVPDGTNNWRLTLPTLGGANLTAVLGDPARLKVNEWMANPSSGDDWFEIYNPNAQAVALGGLYLTDDLNNRLKSVIPALSFIAGGLQGFQQFQADSNPGNGADHANFRLSNTGESLGIATAAGVLIDGVTFSNQTLNVSQGRLPDGAAVWAFFPSTPTPGESNYLPLQTVAINEALTHSDPPFEDAIELRNLTGAAINIGGWFLSDQRTFLQKFRIPDNTMLPANGYKVFYESQFNPVPEDPGSFALSSAKGDQIYLSSSVGGALNGYRHVVDFGAAANGVSFGRYFNSVGVEQFVAMSNKTFGVNSPETVAEFRTGQGQANSYPRVGPIVINQINYHPPDVGTNDNVLDEYIELLNITNAPVPLFDPANPTNHWHLRDAVSYDFAANTTVPVAGRIVVVSFDPTLNPGTLATFRTRFNISAATPVVGPWEGKLDNSTDSVELVRPDAPQTAPSADVGFVPYILVERVKYSDLGPWPADADGNGAALLRLAPTLFGNDPANWIPSTPSGSSDSDSDGLPDSWENQYGLDPHNPNDAAQDPDGDGLSNLAEYQAGTDPTTASSNLRLIITARAPITLQWQAVAGKGYTVVYRNAVGSGTWTTLSTVPAGSARTASVTDPTPVTGTRFYQVRTP